MESFSISKAISKGCGILGLLISGYGLTIGLLSIGASGFGGIGVIFILPSIFAFLIIGFDYLITIDKIKRGLIYSFISTIIKIGIIAYFIPALVDDIKYEMEHHASNMTFDIIVLVSLAIITIPSILNIVKLIKAKKTA